MDRTPEELERHRRIKVSVWAYAYEILDSPLVSDEVFDKECYLVDTSVSTDNPEMDQFFKEHFQPHTGQWIHHHPNLNGIKTILPFYRNQSKQLDLL